MSDQCGRIVCTGIAVLELMTLCSCGSGDTDTELVASSVVTSVSSDSLTTLNVSGTLDAALESTAPRSTITASSTSSTTMVSVPMPGATTSSVPASPGTATPVPTTTRPIPTVVTTSTTSVAQLPPTTTPSAAPTTTPAPPRPVPQAVITLEGSNPPAGFFGDVTLSVASTGGNVPDVAIVDGDCSVTGSGTPTPVLVLEIRTLEFDGTSCSVRATAPATPGFTKPDDKELRIKWTPVLARATWTDVQRVDNEHFTAAIAFSNSNVLGVGLTYNGTCSGPPSVSQGSPITITVVPPAPCSVSGEAERVNQWLWVVVETLTLPV